MKLHPAFLVKLFLVNVSDGNQESMGPLQVCTGQQAGCKAAVHIMRQVSMDTNNEGILFVDASNTFNILNH